MDARDKPGHDGMYAMLGFTRKNPVQDAALDHVREWTRMRFALADDETVMVSEIACTVPGCPPIETHVVFWTAAGGITTKFSSRSPT